MLRYYNIILLISFMQCLLFLGNYDHVAREISYQVIKTDQGCDCTQNG